MDELVDYGLNDCRPQTTTRVHIVRSENDQTSDGEEDRIIQDSAHE